MVWSVILTGFLFRETKFQPPVPFNVENLCKFIFILCQQFSLARDHYELITKYSLNSSYRQWSPVFSNMSLTHLQEFAVSLRNGLAFKLISFISEITIYDEDHGFNSWLEKFCQSTTLRSLRPRDDKCTAVQNIVIEMVRLLQCMVRLQFWYPKGGFRGGAPIFFKYVSFSQHCITGLKICNNVKKIAIEYIVFEIYVHVYIP